MENKKVTLGVFFGGRSCEHDVSIITALQLIKAIDGQKYHVVPVYISQKGQWYTGEKLLDIKSYTNFAAHVSELTNIALDLTPGSGALISYQRGKGLFAGMEQKVTARIECAVLAFHGMHGEDGSMQGIMEIANIPYTSAGVPGCGVTMDKILMKQFIKGGGFPVVPGKWFYRSAWQKNEDSILDEILALGLPVVVKPANLGSSIGVSFVSAKDELTDALEVAFSFDRKVLVEKAIEDKIELNCAVVGYEEEVLASVLEQPKQSPLLTFNEKYLEGAKGRQEGMASLARQIPAPVDEGLRDKIKHMSKEIFTLLDLKGVVRIDYMVDQRDERLYVTEVNTIPGSMAFYLWDYDGLTYTKLIDKLIEYAFEAFEQKNQSSFAFESSILQQSQVAFGKLGTKGTKGQ